MKRIIIPFAALLIVTFSASAQNIAYVNTEKILAEIPEYIEAQDNLSTLSDRYKASIESEIGNIETLYNDYQAKKNTMSASQRTAAEEQIIAKEKAVKEKQKIYFGEDGVMAKKSEELLLPIQKKVNTVIESLAKAGGYDIVLDLAIVQGIVYYDETKDFTTLVISACK